MNSKPVLTRVVGIFQYRENYAAHDWDGKGQCPQGWKNKGGPEITLIDGLRPGDALEIIGNPQPWLYKLCKEHVWADDWSTQELITYNIELRSQPTRDEVIDAYCDWGIDLEDDGTENEHVGGCDIYEDMATNLGY